MTAELDAVLSKADRITRVHELWKSMPGATDEQAIAAGATLAERFVWTGSVLMLDDKPATADAVREKFATNYGFLLPTKSADAPTVDADLAASARAGNMTSYSKIVREHGKAAADSVVAANKSGDDDASKDASKNPWKAENFRTDKAAQARAASIIRSLGTKVAAGLARAAGKDISGAALRG